jgi:hypothetical protein
MEDEKSPAFLAGLENKLTTMTNNGVAQVLFV